jgi:large subunit ribosomal protein L18
MSRAKVIAKKVALRAKRKARVRAKISGTPDFPRVSVFKSNKYISAQVIEDINATTLVHSDGASLKFTSNKEGAKALAADLAAKLKEKNIETVKFDRNGYQYHGVVAAFADALRENGIKV